MAQINPHINFNGNAEEAFTFYKSVFGGEFAKIMHFKDLASPEFPVAEKDENPELHGSEWDHNFSEQNGPDSYRGTKVSITIYNESLERLERILDGFTQGMKMSLTNLENLLATLSQK